VSDHGVERLAAFSDGVFAIAITLLVLPLTEAQIHEETVTADLEALLPKGLTFALSFAVIGRFWLLHHSDVQHITRTDDKLLVFNLAFLFTIAFLPFPTAVLGESSDSGAAAILYAATIMAASLASTAMWWYAARHGLLDPEQAPAAQVRANLAGGLAAALAFAPSIPLALVSPSWAKVSWLLLIPFSMIADRLFPSREEGRRHGRPSTAR
jgi:uncharacterized membrane protein